MKTITILLPCLNEESTLKKCIQGIKKVMNKSAYSYKILLCDNGSEDKSVTIAKKEHIDIVIEKQKGYGATLINGISSIQSDYAVMLDVDLSYNEKDIPKMLSLLDEGYDLVVGNRIREKHEKKGSTLFRRGGAKLLSWYGNILFHTKIKDFHCGLRAFKVKSIQKLNLQASGMEFASEMIIQAKLHHLKMKSINTYFKKEQRTTKAHLKPIRDGFRHLKYITKTKFASSFLFRYLTLFMSALLTLSLLLGVVLWCPNEIPKQKAREEIENIHKYYMAEELNRSVDPNLIDTKADINTLSIIYYLDSSKPWNDLVEMNHVKNVKTLRRNPKLMDLLPRENYARYWHGQILIVKPLLYFLNVNDIKLVFALVLGILIAILTRLLWKKEKILSIAMLLSLLSINIFVIPKCIEYFFAFAIMLLTSILVVKSLDHQEKNMDLIFALSGLFTCFFDFLTNETLTLTIPLLIYAMVTLPKKKKIPLKKIGQWTILWLSFYAATYLAKWGITTLYYSGQFMENIGNQLLLRTFLKENWILIFNDFRLSWKFIYPFYFLPDVWAYFMWGFLAIIELIYILKNHQKRYRVYFFICMIPILRFLILENHLHFHYYFTYRALLPWVILIVYTLLISILKLSKKIKRD